MTTTTTTIHDLEDSLHHAEHTHAELREHLLGLHHRELLPDDALDYQIDGTTLRELLGLEEAVVAAQAGELDGNAWLAAELGGTATPDGVLIPWDEAARLRGVTRTARVNAIMYGTC